MSLREAQSTLIELADVLAAWQRRLSDLKATLPDPVFEAQTDRPLNAAARIVGAIESILLEDLAMVRPDAGRHPRPCHVRYRTLASPTEARGRKLPVPALLDALVPALRSALDHGKQQAGCHGGCGLEELVVPLARIVADGLAADLPVARGVGGRAGGRRDGPAAARGPGRGAART